MNQYLAFADKNKHKFVVSRVMQSLGYARGETDQPDETENAQLQTGLDLLIQAQQN